MKNILKIGLAAGAFLAPLAFAHEAQARDYCREYQKSVSINGHRESGYGTACQQPDGSWMIVSSRGDVDPFDALRARNVNIIAQHQPVYFSYGPRFRPVTYYAYAPRPYYRHYRPGFYFGISQGWRDHDRRDRGHDNRGHHNGRQGNHDHDRRR